MGLKKGIEVKPASGKLGVLLPGFVRTQGEKRVISNALEGLKRRVEVG